MVLQPVYNGLTFVSPTTQSRTQHIACEPHVVALDRIQKNILEEQDLIVSFSKPGDNRCSFSEALYHSVDGGNDQGDSSHQ